MKVTLFGPRVDGSYILRIEGKPNGQSHKVKGHVELNVKSGDLHRVLAEQKLYDDIAALKLAHFVGYIGENHVVKAAKNGSLLDILYMKTNKGRALLAKDSDILYQAKKNKIEKTSSTKGSSVNTQKTNKLYGKSLDKDKVLTLQNKSGHGIDLICKIKNPPPEWVTFEIKTVMKDKFRPNATPTSGKPSEIQINYEGNIDSHSTSAIESFLHSKNDYSLTESQFDMLDDIRVSLKSKQIVGYKITVGLDSGFNPAKNNKYDALFIMESLRKYE